MVWTEFFMFSQVFRILSRHLLVELRRHTMSSQSEGVGALCAMSLIFYTRFCAHIHAYYTC